MLDIGPIPAKSSHDRLPSLGMDAGFARKRQKLERIVQADRGGVDAARNRGAFRLFAITKLDIRPETPVFQRNGEPRIRVVAEDGVVRCGGCLAVAIVARLELAREFAFWIVRASNKCAEAAYLKRKLALP